MATTLAQLIERAKRSIGEKLAARNAAADELNELRAAETTDAARVSEVRARKDGLDAEIDQLRDSLKEYETEQARDEAMQRLSQDVAPAAALPASPEKVQRATTQVLSEPRTYMRETNSRHSFFADAYRWERNGGMPAGDVKERMIRHAREVEHHGEQTKRAAGTGAFAGLVVPQYLVDQAALVLRAGRPIANIAQKHQIPEEGMSFVIPRETTGASAAPQTSENTAVSSTDDVWANLTLPVATGAGAQDVSRQLLERGMPGIDQLIFLDLVRAYAAQVGNAVINGTGANGQVLGILNTAGIGASTAYGAAVTVATYQSKVAGGLVNVYSAGQGLAPKVLAVAPRRWGWLTAQVDSTGRPIVQANQAIAFNTIAQGSMTGEALAAAETPFVGVHSSGLPVLLDLNLPTAVGTPSEDVSLVLDNAELHLWEDGDGMPRQLSFEQTTGGSLTTKLVVYGYYAFTAGRYPQSVSKVGGADTVAGQGQIAPVF